MPSTPVLGCESGYADVLFLQGGNRHRLSGGQNVFNLGRAAGDLTAGLLHLLGYGEPSGDVGEVGDHGVVSFGKEAVNVLAAPELLHGRRGLRLSGGSGYYQTLGDQRGYLGVEPVSELESLLLVLAALDDGDGGTVSTGNLLAVLGG